MEGLEYDRGILGHWSAFRVAAREVISHQRMRTRDLQKFGIIIAGGSGERFWPLSRVRRPKQFLPLGSDGDTLFHEALTRMSAILDARNIRVSTLPSLKPLTLEHGPGLTPEQIFAESVKRNTAGAILWATAMLLAEGASVDSLLCIVPADHRIEDSDGFKRSFTAAIEAATISDSLVTIGITPNRPETGFGYIERAPDPVSVIDGIRTWKALRFHEKPTLAEARSYCEDSRFLWNSGMFIWRIDVFLSTLANVAPNIASTMKRIVDALEAGSESDAKLAFEDLPNLSIDHALMEHAPNVLVTESGFGWDDLGSWEAYSRTIPSSANQNSLTGKAHFIEATGNLVYNDSPAQKVYLHDVHGITVVVTEDAILICPTEKSQDVRKVVEYARAETPESL